MTLDGGPRRDYVGSMRWELLHFHFPLIVPKGSYPE
jgi:hypothetical protein